MSEENNNLKNKIVLEDGVEYEMGEKSKTERSIERDAEDDSYIPVILKRNDETSRHPEDTLERAIHEGVEQHKRKSFSLFLSATAAGLILGFAGMCVAIATQMFPPENGELFTRLASAVVYPLGFIICVLSGTQLFTEHTATAVYPVLDKKASKRSLLKLWITVLAGNMLGTLVSSYLIYLSNPVIMAHSGFLEIANHLIHFEFSEIFISAILAGWLMAQGGWLILVTPHTSSQIMCIYIVTFIIGLGGLHHSIAGSAEIFAGIFHSDNPDYLGSLKFISAAVAGNLFGGSFFVAILNYGHIKRSQVQE